MNKQAKENGGRGIEWTNYTWNPISGCKHQCRWTMPNGQTAICYAEDVAENMAQKNYPFGFSHHYWKPQLLSEPYKVKEPARIFCGSMADVFGHWVPAEQIQTVLNTARSAHWHTFQFLTKNPSRVKQFDIPANCWIGASLPPDFMWGKKLSDNQKRRMFENTLKEWADWHGKALTWLSIEPLSWDAAAILKDYIGAIDWIVIGAASNGKRYHQPRAEWVRDLLALADTQGVPVFFKGNLAYQPHREDFPGSTSTYEPQPLPMVQGTLL